MSDRVIRAFFEDGIPSPTVRRAWLIAILLAPLALAAGLYLRFAMPGSPMPSVHVDRAGALAIARQFASEHGYETADWASLVRLDSDPAVKRWLKDRATAPLREIIERVDPPQSLNVQL